MTNETNSRLLRALNQAYERRKNVDDHVAAAWTSLMIHNRFMDFRQFALENNK